MARKGKNVDSREIVIDRDGKTFTGRYEVTRGIITVTYGFNSRTTQVGGTPVEILARQLLSEIVNTDKT
jgi:hypothetical protein